MLEELFSSEPAVRDEGCVSHDLGAASQAAVSGKERGRTDCRLP